MPRSKFHTLFVLVLSAVAATASAFAQPAVRSGDYDGLLIGVDKSGVLTGYFNQGTGDDGKGSPRFTCTFFIRGTPAGEGRFEIRTWHPGFPAEAVEGELRATENDGKPGVNLRLFGEHGGCWNVAPVLKEEEGLDLELAYRGEWTAIRIVSSARAYFHDSPNVKAKRSAYLVKGDPVKVLFESEGWLEVVFLGPSQRSARGWLLAKDLYSPKL